MDFLVKHQREILLLFVLSALYFILRLPNLTLQPIFVDEAIYIRWAQIMKAEPTMRFLSLADGKTPLFMWLMIPFFKVFNDPLMAGRFLSVLSGYFTFLGVVFLGWKFFDKKTALWTALLIAITPFVVFFDRMSLVDSMLSAFSTPWWPRARLASGSRYPPPTRVRIWISPSRCSPRSSRNSACKRPGCGL